MSISVPFPSMDRPRCAKVTRWTISGAPPAPRLGAAGGQGARAVLEVRSRDVPFIIEDGQIVGRLVYEAMAARPEALYGEGLKSNYQGQALKLSKHFKG